MSLNTRKKTMNNFKYRASVIFLGAMIIVVSVFYVLVISLNFKLNKELETTHILYSELLKENKLLKDVIKNYSCSFYGTGCAEDDEFMPTYEIIDTKMDRPLTAYNVGITGQTDNSPCIGAAGVDLCELVEHDIGVVATNELPLFSKVKINDKIYTVLDRTNKKYGKLYDIAFSASQIRQAKQFGRRLSDVAILQ